MRRNMSVDSPRAGSQREEPLDCHGVSRKANPPRRGSPRPPAAGGALSHGMGSETQRPFAVVIVGGMVSATLFTFILLPLLFPLYSDEGRAAVTPYTQAVS